jgi:uncharacterized protein YjcR
MKEASRMMLDKLEEEQAQDAATDDSLDDELKAVLSKEKRKGGLTEKQQLAINMIIAGVYATEIAEKLDVHVNTIKKWRAQKLFAAEVNKRKKEVMKTAHGVLMASATKAAQQLVELMDTDKPDRNKIALLWRIYEEGKTTSIEDYEERIEKLEEAIETKI